MGLENILAWNMRIGAPFFSVVSVFFFGYMMNLSMSSSTAPKHRKAAWILPIQKILSSLFLYDNRPISITPTLSRLLERIVVTNYIYPFQSTPPNLSFMDKLVSLPTYYLHHSNSRVISILSPLSFKPTTMLLHKIWTSTRPSLVNIKLYE